MQPTKPAKPAIPEALPIWKRAAPRLSALVTMVLTGCAISTPFKWPGLEEVKKARALEVVVAITHVVVKPEHKSEFFRETSNVADAISKSPGLVGYSVRRELLGNQGWTVSVWRDEDSLRRFVYTPEHMRAMSRGEHALKSSEFYRVKVPTESLPLDWSRILALMQTQKDVREAAKRAEQDKRDTEVTSRPSTQAPAQTTSTDATATQTPLP